MMEKVHFLSALEQPILQKRDMLEYHKAHSPETGNACAVWNKFEFQSKDKG